MSSSVTCHLERGDGSRWIVTAYDRGRGGVTVCAVRELRPHGADGDAVGETEVEPSVREEDGRTSLWRARLEEGDRLEWRGADGRVLASSIA